MGEFAELQTFAKGLADIGFWRVVVAMPVELACTCQRVPGRVEILYNEYQSVAAFAVASLLALLRCSLVKITTECVWPAPNTR